MPDPEANVEQPALASSVVRWGRAFGAFWWDFLVGETPELLVGVLVALGLVALLAKASALNAVAVGALPAIVVVLLAGSLLRAKRAGKAERAGRERRAERVATGRRTPGSRAGDLYSETGSPNR